jgi:predicted metal-dependent hydrolase
LGRSNLGGKLAKPSLKYYYNVYNKRYFRDRLPKDCIIQWADLKYRNANAICITEESKKDKIQISQEFVNNPTVALHFLLHEMCHLKLKNKTLGHGPIWQREMKSLAARGAFNKMW